MKRFYTHLITAILLAISLFIYLDLQKPLTYENGLASDGIEYLKVAENFSNGNTPSARAPFVYRIATGYLASKYSDSNLINSFLIINISASLISVFLLLYLLYLYSDNHLLNLAAITFYIFHWLMPLRYFIWDPVSPDPLYLLIMLLGLIFIKKESKYTMIILIFLSIIGAFVRETALIPALVYFFLKNDIQNILKFKINIKSTLPALLGITTLISLKFFVNEENNYQYFAALFIWIYKFSPIQFLLSTFKIYGLLLPLFFIFRKDIWIFLRENRELLIFLVIILSFSIIGGADKERFISWTFPAVAIILVHIFSKNSLSNKIYVPIIISLLFTLRIFFVLPIHVEENYILPLIPFSANEFHFGIINFSKLIYESIFLLLEYLIFSLGIVFYKSLKSR